MSVKTFFFGLVTGFALTFLSASILGSDVDVITLDGDRSMSGSGRYTLSESSSEPVQFRIFDSETGTLRVFSDSGQLIEISGGEPSASTQ